jgi:hypothetical protein
MHQRVGNDIEIVLVALPCLSGVSGQWTSGLAPTIFFLFSLLSLIFIPDSLNFQRNHLICFSFNFGSYSFDCYLFYLE